MTVIFLYAGSFMEIPRGRMLQLFILSLATLAVSATGVLFVKPTNETSCPHQPCHTLEHYAQSWQLYLTSKTIVQFLPGEHVLEGDWNWLTVENVSNLTLIGSDSVVYNSAPLGIPVATSRVNCRGGKTSFFFYNVTALFITRLTILECGGEQVTLLLYKVSNLVVDSVTIQNSTGTGLFGYNLGKSSIRHSAFVFSQATSGFAWTGNIALVYEECSDRIETSTMNVMSSWISFGNATDELSSVGGLNLLVSPSCYNIKVHIHNTTFRKNMGGNMFLGLNGFAHNIITITDSYFEGSYNTVSGGGMLVLTTYDPSQVFQFAQPNLVYINNTVFVDNQAEYGGAMFVLPCSGTELYINGSRFYTNIAHHGGHIALYCLETCTNISIKINNCLFEDGKATGNPGGGGIAIEWTNLQCENSNNISISKSQFVGNYAEHSGGAVLLQGCVGIHIEKSEFYNNTTPSAGGHISLELQSDSVQHYINNCHFESGSAFIGGGISVFAGSGSCTSVSGSIHKPVYILNSRVYQNVAEQGGGIAIQFNQNCLAIDVSIHNVSLSRNTATNFSGGNIYLYNYCTAGNSATISSSTLEYGNANDSGGGMAFVTSACSSSMVSLKAITINIADSMFQYNTAHALGGGLCISHGLIGLSEYSCCSAEVNITDVTFLNNNVSTVPVLVNGMAISTKGGNIYIADWNGQLLNNSVRIHNCLIKGGVAGSGGGIFFMQTVQIAVSWQNSTEMEGLFISNTHFVCNRATADTAGASLVAEGKLLKNFSMTLNSLTPTVTKSLTIMNTVFDGSCADSSNVNIVGLGVDAPYLPIAYTVVFSNVSFRGYSTNLSSPLSTFYSQQSSLNDDLLQSLPNPSTTLYTYKPGVVLSSIPNVTFIDCEFFESSADSALTAGSTNMFFGGNIIFRDNIATYGAGLQLLENSVMYLRPNTHLMFSHNHATYAGGAIYVQSVDSSGHIRCFFQLEKYPDQNIQILFKNNTAYFAGSALYGGLVDFCLPNNGERNNYFDSIFKIQNTDEDPSAISSNPYMVCLCNNSKPLSGNHKYVPIRTYPGALFHVQAVVVGQKNGIAPGVVLATLQNTSAVLGDLQQSQAIGKSCTTLNYTVYSSRTVETVTLVTENIPGRMTFPGLIINVTLLTCPWGFTLSTDIPTKCNCADELRNHHIDKCDITTQTITHPPPLWIGYYHSGNNTEHLVQGVLVHDQCPFDYCKPGQLSIQLNDSDKQCAFNHSGILCGACQPGLSLALGTSRCLKCSNKYLMLLFAFTVAGLVLVFLLTLTNMTVSEGTINGLIFYANIIHINRAIFFPNESIGINKILLDILYTFISWINLDLGIETCFYSGMDMYTKAWLQFLFPIYIWTIVGGMIVSSHYSTAAAKLFRRHAVKVLATLFLLSFAKLQRTIITALSFTFLTYPDGTKTVWLYDSNIEYLHGKHIVLFIAAVLALLFFLIPYTLVLLLIQCLPKLNCRIFFWVKKLKPLFDAYTGPYKDRYRFWTGFLLVVRTVLFLIFTVGNPGLNLTAISATSTCLAFAPAVYKKVWLTLLEYSLLLNLGVASVATFYCRDPQYSCNQAVVVYISVGTALMTFIGILVYHLSQCTINSQAWKTISNRVTQRNNNRELVNIAVEGSDEEEEEEPAQAEIRPLMLQFDEYREPVLVYEDQN